MKAKIIQTEIENWSTKAAIAKTLAKDESTIAKEIKKHRKLHQYIKTRTNQMN